MLLNCNVPLGYITIKWQDYKLREEDPVLNERKLFFFTVVVLPSFEIRNAYGNTDHCLALMPRVLHKAVKKILSPLAIQSAVRQ